MQDVPNTAAGRWLFGTESHDDPHLSLVHDNVDAEAAAVSMGTSVPSIPLGVYKFAPLSTGRVNRDFKFVTADGVIYCYSFSSYPFGQSVHALVQLVSATTLRIQGFSGTACGDPSTWVFTSAAVTFGR